MFLTFYGDADISRTFLSLLELPAQNRRDIWSLSDSDEIRTDNHLVRKRTLCCHLIWAASQQLNLLILHDIILLYYIILY